MYKVQKIICKINLNELFTMLIVHILQYKFYGFLICIMYCGDLVQNSLYSFMKNQCYIKLIIFKNVFKIKLIII